jgi:hypothetical protein
MEQRLVPLWLCSFLFVIAAVAAEPVEIKPLIPNGNFEADSKAVGWPDGWGNFRLAQSTVG